MKNNEKVNIGYNKVANASSVMVVLLLGFIVISDLIRLEEGFIASLAGLGVAAALLLLIPFFKSTKNLSNLACYTPLVLFIFYTVLMALIGWTSPYYLIACLCFCGISAIYFNFKMTLWYIIIQNIVVGILIFGGTPLMGAAVPLRTVLVTWFFVLFGAVFMLILTRASSDTKSQAIHDQNSFRTLLSTTPNYIAMVDQLNYVTYVSKSLSQLARIEDPGLAMGRPLIDLFPGRELKLLAGKMLGQTGGLYEDDWEFTLHGQKRYFKVVSDNLAGNSIGTLINLHDMTHLAERDEIAIMKDSLKIGLFFMDKNYIIQDQYSRFLEEMLSERDLAGKLFTDILSSSVTAKELAAIRDYFDMIYGRAFDQRMLDDINPLNELHYVSVETGNKKILHCGFATVERGHGEVFALVTVYDITAKVELQQRLLEEESKRQEEMKSIFEIIQVEPRVFNDFLEDAGYEFTRIDDALKNTNLSTHELLVEIYQSVHAIKSNAVILGLNVFGNKVHNLESKIKKLREYEGNIPFDDTLHLTMELEKLAQEKDSFKTTIDKIQSLKVSGGEGRKQNEYILVESLTKTTNKAAMDLDKKVELVVDGIDSEAIEKGPRRVIKEVLMQLIRNSVVHGIEAPDERLAQGKEETGAIHLSIKLEGEKIHVRLKDDGRGLDFNKIREKAERLNIIRKEERNNKNLLVKAIFSPGFSTAETEGVHAGRGIGLNLVRDRVHDVHGSIKLQSETGKGTIFSIYFPVENIAESEPVRKSG